MEKSMLGEAGLLSGMPKQSLDKMEETPDRYIEISEELAKERNIESGRWVRVISRHGSLVIKTLVTSRVFGHQVYLPLFVAGGADQYPDRISHGPCYQHPGVQGDCGANQTASEQGTNPLRPLNPAIPASRLLSPVWK
jgi:formate dehydrogenase major subunit